MRGTGAQIWERVQLGVLTDPQAPGTSSPAPSHARRLIRRLAALSPLSGLPRGLTLLRAHTCDLPHNSAGTTPSRNPPVRKREAPSACGSYRSGHYTQEHRDHLPYSFCSQMGREAQVFAAKTLNQRRSTQWDQFQVSCTYQGLGL